jgi:translation initiation factor 6
MKFAKFSIRGSPFIGIFCRTTEKIALVPHGLLPKERKALEEILQTELVECSLANSTLIGVLTIGNRHGFVGPSIIEQQEINSLQSNGIKIKRIPGVDALGNLVSVNDSTGVCSPGLSEKTMKEIETTLKIRLMRSTIANSDLVGSAMVLTNKGFVCNPGVNKNELQKITKVVGKKGNPTSANFGDAFVGNSVIANSSGALIGQNSTPREMLAIDEALSGDA